MTARRIGALARVGAMAVLASVPVLMAAGCASTNQALSIPAGAGSSARSPISTTRATLAPSIPEVFRTGTNNCGNPYAISATTSRATIGLLDCPELAGLQPTPTVDVRVGDDILISGMPKTSSLTVKPDTLALVGPGMYEVTVPGTVAITIHNYPCIPRDDAKAQPYSCALLDILTS